MSKNNRVKNNNQRKENVEMADKENTDVQEMAVEMAAPVINKNPKQNEPVPAPVVEEKVQTQQPVVQRQESTTKLGASQVSDLEKKLMTYVEGMLKNLPAKETAKIQYSFFLTLRSVLAENDPEVFRKSWNAILNFANRNQESVFNEMHIFRGAEAWPTSQLEFSLFRRLGWLILETANPQTRRVKVLGLSLQKVTEGMKEAERIHLLNFYS